MNDRERLDELIAMYGGNTTVKEVIRKESDKEYARKYEAEEKSNGIYNKETTNEIN